MIDIDIAEEAIGVAKACDLESAYWIDWLGVEKVASACNGCGPEWLGTWGREKLTKFLDLFFPAFCIHDCRFTYANDGSKKLFDFANDELERNCYILANSRYRWWNPMRYVWHFRADVVADACRDFGWSAWRDAYGKSKEVQK